MSDTEGSVPQPAPEVSPGATTGPVDLSVLETVEAELSAVERALEQIDQGVYEGFAGLGEATAG